MGFERIKAHIDKNALYQVLFSITENSIFYYKEGLELEGCIKLLYEEHINTKDMISIIKKIEKNIDEVKKEMTSIDYLAQAYKEQMGKENKFLTLSKKNNLKEQAIKLWKEEKI